MCGSKPKMPPAAAPAPPPIPEATSGAVAPILGNDQTQLRRFDALRELSKLVIPGEIKPVVPSGAPPPPTDPRAGHNSRSTHEERSQEVARRGYGAGNTRGLPTRNQNNTQSAPSGIGINRRR